jgi:hypothetical protein
MTSPQSRLSMDIFSDTPLAYRPHGNVLSDRSLPQLPMSNPMNAFRNLQTLDLTMHDRELQYLSPSDASRGCGDNLRKMLRTMASTLRELKIHLVAAFSPLTREWNKSICCFHRQSEPSIPTGTYWYSFENLIQDVDFARSLMYEPARRSSDWSSISRPICSTLR